VPGDRSQGYAEKRLGRPFHHSVLAIASFCKSRIGWHGITVTLSLSIIAVALVVLYRELDGIDINHVRAAFLAIRPQRVALAACCVAAAYFTLTFYDLFALRTLRHDAIPYRVAALAAFTSYSVGHNVGVTAITGGALRYHIYWRHGLGVVDVAKICFLAALTFWLGNAAALGLGVMVEPHAAAAIDKLSPAANRVIAGAVLVALAGYLVWVSRAPRLIGLGKLEVSLPGGPSTILQMVIGFVDLTCCALAMYALLPESTAVDFLPLAVVFVSATLLGFASHAPGGLGVFDAAMLVGLSQFDRGELLAGLLCFRLLYYIVPFAVSLLILAGREIAIGIALRDRRRRRLLTMPHIR